MKNLAVILLSGVVLVLAGCGNQGGSSDPYNTESGITSNTNYDRIRITNDYQGSANSPGSINGGADSTNYGVLTDDLGSAASPGRTNSGDGSSTNYPGFGTNDQSGATNSYKNGGQPIDPERTNDVPKN